MPLDSPTITADFSHVEGQAGDIDWRVSRQWASRPDDQRYTSLDDMLRMMDERTERSFADVFKLRDLRPMISNDELGFELDGRMLEPTNYSFSQICQEASVPASFMKRLSDNTRLVTECLQYGINTMEDQAKEAMILRSGNSLRAVTGPNYGRIWDREIVRAVKQITDESGAQWEVPVAFAQPGEVRYECVDPTKEETTLYASDRDCFLFLVDQRNPIQVGFVTDPRTGERKPDMYSRGFYVWNGECGGVSNGVATFLYRWCCANRSIRDQKGFERVSINHTKNAGELFAKRLLPALKGFVDGSTAGIVAGLETAKRTKVARTDDDRMAYLIHGYKFGQDEAKAIMGKCLDEEGHPIETAWDAVQAMTAWARLFAHQDRRVHVERQAGKIMAAAERSAF